MINYYMILGGTLAKSYMCVCVCVCDSEHRNIGTSIYEVRTCINVYEHI